MGSAFAQLAGNVATDLSTSLDNPGHERVSFRLIANERRRDAAGTWIDGDECALTVVCWGQLAKGVAQSVGLGDPVSVAGKLVTRRYEVDGQPRYATELKATQVGHDLARGKASFHRSGPRDGDRTDNGADAGARSGSAAAGAPVDTDPAEHLATVPF